MTERFENLTTGVSRIYKSIQRLKNRKMTAMGLKGAQVMCIYYLSDHPEGMTAAELSRVCQEDKAATSRILSELEKLGLIAYRITESGKKYRAQAVLTDAGKEYASRINLQIFQATEAGGQDITEKEREIFYHVLFQIADNLERLSSRSDSGVKNNRED